MLSHKGGIQAPGLRSLSPSDASHLSVPSTSFPSSPSQKPEQGLLLPTALALPSVALTMLPLAVRLPHSTRGRVRAGLTKVLQPACPGCGHVLACDTGQKPDAEGHKDKAEGL